MDSKDEESGKLYHDLDLFVFSPFSFHWLTCSQVMTVGLIESR